MEKGKDHFDNGDPQKSDAAKAAPPKKRIAIMSETRGGTKLSLETAEKIRAGGRYEADCYAAPRFAEEFKIESVGEDLTGWTGEHWDQYEGFVYITATGTAVRAIAPWLEREEDTFAVVLDESCQYIIPLISNRRGLASAMASMIGRYVGAVPVFTTSIARTEGVFPLEQFISDQGLDVPDRRLLRLIAAGIAGGRNVGFYCEYPIEGEVPKELSVCKEMEDLEKYTYGLAINRTEGIDKLKNAGNILQLIPRDIVVGLDYKGNVTMQHLREQIRDVLTSRRIQEKELEKLMTSGAHKTDAGLAALGKRWNIPVVFYAPDELESVKAVSKPGLFSFHRNRDWLAERAAILGSGQGSVIVPEMINGGIHICMARRNWKVQFREMENE